MITAFAHPRRIVVAVSTVALVAALGAAEADDFTGAGATFPAPIYAAWSAAYKTEFGSGLNYQAIGSGGGVARIQSRTVDFGASDAPVAADRLTAGRLLQFPTVIGAVVPIVDLAGIEADRLILDGATLTDIYLGRITRWDDPRIAALNPGVTLPTLDILPTCRSDGSGTTYVFASYLADVSPEWKSSVGVSTSVRWPACVGVKGSDGVSGAVKTTLGAIGYVEYVHAASNGLTTTRLINKAGKAVAPTVSAFQAAADDADWAGAKTFAASMINTKGDAAWPITSATYILLPKDPKDTVASAEVMKFFDWAYREGGATAEKLHYIPLPASVQNDVRKAWKAEIKDGRGGSVMK